LINTREIGTYGENIAIEYLLNKGYKFIAKNFRSKFGEIDIIVKEKDCICFVEVKTRYNKNFGFPSQSVSYNKQRRIKKTSLLFVNKEKLFNLNLRYDVVEVYLNYNDDSYIINHLENAF
jgi:putative endonuclease